VTESPSVLEDWESGGQRTDHPLREEETSSWTSTNNAGGGRTRESTDRDSVCSVLRQTC
jgi:hypothetical protein